nr:ATP synthase F0 subunit 8 [Anaplecta sp. 5 ZQW-2020]WAX39184.1 ATP synthase F0 subunit 8 [Anaplecta sp. 5 ZQW-2020]
MPQMMPMSWLMLFMMFTTTFITFNVLSYFNYKQQPHNKKMKNYKNNTMTWKW